MNIPHNDFPVKIEWNNDTYYSLAMFPYPSGAGLHAGHASNFIINDIVARYQRMQGKNVLNPFGLDSFGLPTENYAIKVGKRADVVTQENAQNFIEQLKQMNLSYDWDRMLLTSDPSYYKWTQWIFTKLFEKGLAYRGTSYVNWSDASQTVLANSQVVDGKDERTGEPVRQKEMTQWFIKITDYADRLIDDLDLVDWPEETKKGQKNWIWRSEGAEIDFHIKDKTITVFTTRPDTLYGVTWLVLAPENELLDDMIAPEHKDAVLEYRKTTKAKTSIQRQEEIVNKSGVFSWLYATHPLTGDKVPVRYADYVLMDYGTGAVMSVPAHDQRDRDFAHKHGLEIKQVIEVDLSKNDVYFQDQEASVRWDNSQSYVVCKIGPYYLWKFEWVLKEGKRTVFKGWLRIPFLSTKRIWELCLLLKDFGENNVSTSVLKYNGFDATIIDCKFDIIDDFRNILHNNNFEGFHFSWNFNHTSDILSFNATEPATRFFLQDKYYQKAYWDSGRLINSWQFSGMTTAEAKSAIIDHLEKERIGRRKTTYKLRDRSVSRQRYRWSPIPIYYDQNGEPHAIPESQLPVVLPLDLEEYHPKGVSPLEQDQEFMTYTAPDGTTYKREGDTLDTFMCSSFYFLRFLDPHNDKELVKKEIAEAWLPVDFYIGGKEHTVWHLLYARFIHKFLYDEWYVSTPEPFAKLVHQGMIHAEDGRKMSKRRWNVVNPLDVIEKYSADTLRTYLMFMKPVTSDSSRDSGAVNGVHKFLKRARELTKKISDIVTDDQHSQVDSLLHATIIGVRHDMETLKYNTAVSKLMIFVNDMQSQDAMTPAQYRFFLQMLAPFATEMSQELWQQYGWEGDIHVSSYPVWDANKIITSNIDLPVQFKGKMRWTVSVSESATQEEVIDLIMQDTKLKSYYEAGDIKKIIFVPGKIMNIIN